MALLSTHTVAQLGEQPGDHAKPRARLVQGRIHRQQVADVSLGLVVDGGQ